jgi:hypothetical protein
LQDHPTPRARPRGRPTSGAEANAASKLALTRPGIKPDLLVVVSCDESPTDLATPIP